MSKNYTEYLDLVLLIRKTTKIESTLEALGGEGGGIWEKADSINLYFPEYFMKKIYKVATYRNDAIHGDLKVKNIDVVVRECDSVLKMLDDKKKIDNLKNIVQHKVNILGYVHGKSSVGFSENLKEWITALYAYKTKNPKKDTDVKALLDEELFSLKEINGYIRKKRLKIFSVLLGIVAFPVIIYVLIRMVS